MVKRKYDSLQDVPPHILAKLAHYVSNLGGRTFTITGLPSELTGATLARYSRAPTGLQLTLVNEFLDDEGNPSQAKGTEMLDRVLNAFGDDSVGELEGIHVGIEDISQVATKFIEDRRIGASPIEQSTRYVRYDVRDAEGRWRYLRPQEIMHSGLDLQFEAVNDRAFSVYSELVTRLIDYFKQEFPRTQQTIDVDRNGKKIKAGEADLIDDTERRAFNQAYSFTIRCAALDVGRAVLPSSTLTHLGLLGNGRYFTNLITYLKSSEFVEAQERGYELEHELNKSIPTFIKRNGANPKVATINAIMHDIASELFHGMPPHDTKVTLLPRGDYLEEVVASALFPYTYVSLPQIMDVVHQLPQERKFHILDLYKGKRESRRDRTGRGLEAGYPLTFDLVGGFAEYRDLERHRMLTQQRQDLTTGLGFILPPEINAVDMGTEVEEVVSLMDELNSNLRHAGLRLAAQYATLFNHRIRFMFGMNLREFQHLTELRTQPAGHFSYRSMTMEMARQVTAAYPWAQQMYEFVNYSDPGNKIARADEQSKIAGRNIAKKITGDTDL